MADCEEKRRNHKRFVVAASLCRGAGVTTARRHSAVATEFAVTGDNDWLVLTWLRRSRIFSKYD